MVEKLAHFLLVMINMKDEWKRLFGPCSVLVELEFEKVAIRVATHDFHRNTKISLVIRKTEHIARRYNISNGNVEYVKG
jgi:hypothetical protein